MIGINEYLSVLPGVKASDKICETQLNEILLSRIPNICIRQAYMQELDCETITLRAVNIFELMETSEYIYEVVLEPHYKKPAREYFNRTGHSRKMRGEVAS